jgi:uncharacterized protein YihD (DUF1040 family)
MANEEHLELIKQGVDVWNKNHDESLRAFLEAQKTGYNGDLEKLIENG